MENKTIEYMDLIKKYDIKSFNTDIYKDLYTMAKLYNVYIPSTQDERSIKIKNILNKI